MFGIFSQKAYEMYGSVFYSTPSGETVQVTCVLDSIENLKDVYRWDDAIVVGEVLNYVTSDTKHRDHNHLYSYPRVISK